MTIGYQKDADGCQPEVCRLTLSVSDNKTTRSMLHHHKLFVFSQLRFASGGGY